MALECSTPSLATRANAQHVGAIRLVLLPNGLLYGSHLHLLHKNRSAPLTLATIIHHDINSLLSSSLFSPPGKIHNRITFPRLKYQYLRLCRHQYPSVCPGQAPAFSCGNRLMKDSPWSMLPFL